MDFESMISVLLIFIIIFLLATNTKAISYTGNTIANSPMNLADSFNSWLNRQAGVLP